MLALLNGGCGRGIDPYLVGHTLYYSPRREGLPQQCFFLLYKIFLGSWVDLAWDKQKPGDLMIAFRIFSLSMLDRVVMPRVDSKAWISMGKYGLLPIKDCY